ncbi:MAG: hypothetical protein IPJ30_19910 [Acidobacteria bacterium]|nr:hypothetical protein [Acidobacteriota bacterium]
MEESTFQGTPVTIVGFRNDRSFKVKKETNVKLRFLRSECRSEFRKSEQYLVFDEGATFHDSCNRTQKFSEASADTLVVKWLSGKEVSVSVGAKLEGLSEDELKTTRISISGADSVFQPALTVDGGFSQAVPRLGTYRVEIEIELIDQRKVSVFSLSRFGETSFTKNQGSRALVRFESGLFSNGCDFRRILFQTETRTTPKTRCG